MRCPFCEAVKTRSLECRRVTGHPSGSSALAKALGCEISRRRRVCDGCDRRFTTFEIPAHLLHRITDATSTTAPD